MNIVITGASAGIGYALAEQYAQAGNTLGLIGRSSEKLAAIEAACRRLGAEVVTASIDVTDAQALQRWLDEFDGVHPVDLLIANAGVTSIMPDTGDAESRQAVQQVLDTNVYGVINSIYPLLEPMRRRGLGQIAIISSLAAFYGLPITPAYCASKSAVKAYGEALRGWLKPQGVAVSVVCPGFVRSELSDQFPEPKRWIMSAKKAARLIAHGLAARKAYISFPYPLALGMKLLALLPAAWADRILRELGYGAVTSKRVG